jgi:hypothetical protein
MRGRGDSDHRQGKRAASAGEEEGSRPPAEDATNRGDAVEGADGGAVKGAAGDAIEEVSGGDIDEAEGG